MKDASEVNFDRKKNGFKRTQFNKKHMNGTIETLLQTLPPMFARINIGKLTGGLIDDGTMANLDSQGKGPKRITIGRKSGYIREDFVQWMVERMGDLLSK